MPEEENLSHRFRNTVEKHKNTTVWDKQSPKATNHDFKALTQYSYGLSNIFIHECSLECLSYPIQPIGSNIREAAESGGTQKMLGYSERDTRKTPPTGYHSYQYFRYWPSAPIFSTRNIRINTIIHFTQRYLLWFHCCGPASQRVADMATASTFDSVILMIKSASLVFDVVGNR